MTNGSAADDPEDRVRRRRQDEEIRTAESGDDLAESAGRLRDATDEPPPDDPADRDDAQK